MHRVYLDSMIFIYAEDSRAPLHAEAIELLKRFERGPHALVSSLYVMAELMVIPLRYRDDVRISSLQRFFASSSLELLLFTREAALTYSSLRAHFRVEPLDALHLATASAGRCDLFVTNDHKLRSLKSFESVNIIGLDEVLQFF